MAENDKLKQLAASLSEIEKRTLMALIGDGELDENSIAEKAQLNVDAVRRAIGWMRDKGLLQLSERLERGYALTKIGKETLVKNALMPLPEQRLYFEFAKAGAGKIGELRVRFGDEREFNFALGYLRKKSYIVPLAEGEFKLIVESSRVEFGDYAPAKVLRKCQEKSMLLEDELQGEEKNAAEGLVVRGLLEKREVAFRKFKVNETGEAVFEQSKSAGPREYDVTAPVPKLHVGKRQPYVQFLNLMRKKLIGLGFREMESPLVTTEFYNFDVLFQPQNHPARTWTDTYQLKKPQFGKLPDKKIVEAVKNAHEFGEKTGSRGWGYKWDPKVAARLMPAAHCTAHSARQIVKGVEIPGKYFAISRCYRPDVVDASHLIEFNQMDGFVVGEGINFRHLLGLLKQFAIEVAGAKEVGFRPDYFPFTEPSVELSAKHPKLGWIEFAGSGIFRPEMTEPLGIKEPVIAWGMGIERLFMFKMGIKDIRYLFSEDLNWLREAKLVGIE